MPIIDNPNKNVTGDQSKTLFVARLSKDTTQGMEMYIFTLRASDFKVSQRGN